MHRVALVVISLLLPPSAWSQQLAPGPPSPGPAADTQPRDVVPTPAAPAPSAEPAKERPAAEPAVTKAAAPTTECGAAPTILPQASRECPETGRRGAAVRVGRVAVETLLGAGLGAVAGIAGAYAGLNVDLLSGKEAGAGLSVGTALGYTLGVAPGVWLAGRAMGGDGSFGWTLLGSALGTGVSSGLLALNDKPPMLAFAATVPLAAATIAYELSSHRRRAKPGARPTAHQLLLPTLGPTTVGLLGKF